jgi:hypothetical protein
VAAQRCVPPAGDGALAPELAPACVSVDAPASDTAKPVAPARSSGAPAGTCKVPGCAQAVSQKRAIGARYHLCDMHLASPVVLIQGSQMRFCQARARAAAACNVSRALRPTHTRCCVRHDVHGTAR